MRQDRLLHQMEGTQFCQSLCMHPIPPQRQTRQAMRLQTLSSYLFCSEVCLLHPFALRPVMQPQPPIQLNLKRVGVNLSTTSGFCFSFETRLSACDLSISYTCVSVAGIFPESIASAIWVPIAPQPNRPILFKSIKMQLRL